MLKMLSYELLKKRKTPKLYSHFWYQERPTKNDVLPYSQILSLHRGKLIVIYVGACSKGDSSQDYGKKTRTINTGDVRIPTWWVQCVTWQSIDSGQECKSMTVENSKDMIRFATCAIHRLTFFKIPSTMHRSVFCRHVLACRQVLMKCTGGAYHWCCSDRLQSPYRHLQQIPLIFPLVCYMH